MLLGVADSGDSLIDRDSFLGSQILPNPTQPNPTQPYPTQTTAVISEDLENESKQQLSSSTTP